MSAVLVPDPLYAPAPDALASHFTLCRPFKTHHIVDRRLGPSTPTKHHRDRIRRGERRASCRLVCLRQPLWQSHWRGLYAGLVGRHGITGVQAFPGPAFAKLAELRDDQLVTFAAEDSAGDVLAMQIWIRHADRAYCHLTATSEAGYRALATYVTYATAIDFLKDCTLLDLGGGAGHLDDPDGPLGSFKRGFANSSCIAHLCGAILDGSTYAELCGSRPTEYFPAYRDGR